MPQPHECQQLLDVLAEVHALALEREQCQTSAIEQVAPRHQESARNLVHYAALRSFDLRPLQLRLSALGLSSLGRSEVSVLPSIRAVEQNLARWLPEPESFSSAHELKSELHRESFKRNTLALLGPQQTKRETRILVTAPRAAADDPTFVAELLSAGTDLLRINCAHDDADAWRKMVENVRQAEWETNRRCRILCDLAGPKLRTGPLAKEQGKKLVLSEGEQLWLTRKRLPGKSANKDPAHISCSLPEVLDQVQCGHRVFFDDGKIAARVLQVSKKGALLEITSKQNRLKLKADKGINLPDTELTLPALLPHDLEALDFIAEHADLVGQSFLRGPEDVLALHRELHRRNATELGVILKIETPGAFSRLPDVLLAGLRHERVGVMVARGDLAVEVGFERLAEAQEEILWMAEAAHIPVVWATQVLENLAKTGMPTRAEVTDAAMSGRAECVMLNKGPYVVEAVRFLDDVLTRMASHQAKKRSQLRALSISHL